MILKFRIDGATLDSHSTMMDAVGVGQHSLVSTECVYDMLFTAGEEPTLFELKQVSDSLDVQKVGDGRKPDSYRKALCKWLQLQGISIPQSDGTRRTRNDTSEVVKGIPTTYRTVTPSTTKTTKTTNNTLALTAIIEKYGKSTTDETENCMSLARVDSSNTVREKEIQQQLQKEQQEYNDKIQAMKSSRGGHESQKKHLTEKMERGMQNLESMRAELNTEIKSLVEQNSAVGQVLEQYCKCRPKQNELEKLISQISEG